MSITLAAFLALTAVAPAQQRTNALRGHIMDERAHTAVAGAVVHIAGESVARYVLTDDAGAYAFADLLPGRYRVGVTHPGYESMSLEVELRAGTQIELDVPLRLRPVRARPLRVMAERNAVRSSGDIGETRLAPGVEERWLRTGPLSASALSDMVAAQTAARPSPDGRDAPHVLYIWGTNTEQGRVLLDGASLGAPLHLGGLLPPLDPDLIANASYHTAGASPRFDGGTTHIMEFRTRPAADHTRAWGEVDALTSRAGFEAPIGAGGVLVGARRVNDEVIGWITGRPLDYAYADVLARSDVSASAHDRLHATVFATDEAITMPRDLDEDRASWSNLAFATGWKRSGDNETSVDVSFGRAIADLPYLRAPKAHVVSSVDRTALNAAHTLYGARTTTTMGVDIEHHRFGRRATGIDSPALLGSSGCDADATCLEAAITMLSGYGEVGWQPRRGLKAEVGARVGYDATQREVRLLPRASLTAILDERTAVSLSAGRYSRATIVDDSAVSGTSILPLLDADGSRALTPTTAVATASHAQLSITTRFATSVFAGASAIVRRHDAVRGVSAHTAPGLDVWLSATGPVDATVGYSYLHRRGTSSTPGTRSDRHVFAATVAHSTGPARIHLSAAWAVGLPFVSLALDDPDQAPLGSGFDAPTGSAVPEGNYLRIDAGATATWHVDWLERETSLTPYVKLVNALGRRDALFFYRESAGNGGLRALASVPLVPTIGLRWAF